MSNAVMFSIEYSSTYQADACICEDIKGQYALRQCAMYMIPAIRRAMLTSGMVLSAYSE